MNRYISDIDTVRLNPAGDGIEIIDQTKLPGRIHIETLKRQEDIWHAINILQVRGAPAIGVTAGFAMYLAALAISRDQTVNGNPDHMKKERFFTRLAAAKTYLNSARPTAVNLSWATQRMEDSAKKFFEENPAKDNLTTVLNTVEHLKAEALSIYEEDIATCKAIGENALTLVKKGDGLLTHCNAGKLATVRYGTATSVMYLGHEKGYGFKIYCDETRPLNQGSRLTAFELSEAGMDVTLLCDNMSASLMKSGAVNAIFVGCDRVAANGDTANKIGTSLLALAAKHYNVPFYVCAPTSTIDLSCSCGDEIVIEQRPSEEVTKMWFENPIAPEKIKVYNPSFDVTDASLISAIITEKGIIKGDYLSSLKNLT